MQHTFEGLGVAVITPFLKDGTIDEPALKKVIQHLIAGGVNYVVALGTTGESATLQAKEKQKVIEIFIEEIQGKIPLVIGIGGNHTSAIIQQIKAIENLSYDGILSVSPYYNKPTQHAIIKHYECIAESTAKPIILYNVPGRTASNLSAETTLHLAHQCKNIVAIKEASGNLQQMMEIIKDKPEDFALISGDDALTLPVMSIGGLGLISVAANAFPKIYQQIVDACLQGNFKAAESLFYPQLPILKSMFAEGNPTGVKYVMKQLGLCENYLRLPLISASEQLTNLIDEQLSVVST